MSTVLIVVIVGIILFCILVSIGLTFFMKKVKKNRRQRAELETERRMKACSSRNPSYRIRASSSSAKDSTSSGSRGDSS